TGATPPARAIEGPPYRFLPAEGPGLHQIPVGPVHAGIIEPGHFRFTASGETVVRLEERLGYTHKGIERLMAGQDLEPASRIAARLSGDSTVACSWAFVQAVEGALDFRPPPRAVWLRGVMAELERIANHLGDIGAICNDAAPVEMVVRQEGDVDARGWVRILEVERSISWLRTALTALPSGPVRLPAPATPATSVECTAMVEGFRGDILAYVRIGAGRIER